MADRAHLERMTRDLTDKGQLIEAGWVSLRLTAIPLDAPASQLDEMRTVFFAGAQHLFGSIMTVLEPGDEPSAGDIARLDLIDAELKRFIVDWSARRASTKGNA